MIMILAARRESITNLITMITTSARRVSILITQAARAVLRRVPSQGKKGKYGDGDSDYEGKKGDVDGDGDLDYGKKGKYGGGKKGDYGGKPISPPVFSPVTPPFFKGDYYDSGGKPTPPGGKKGKYGDFDYGKKGECGNFDIDFTPPISASMSMSIPPKSAPTPLKGLDCEDELFFVPILGSLLVAFGSSVALLGAFYSCVCFSNTIVEDLPLGLLVGTRFRFFGHDKSHMAVLVVAS